MEGPGKIKTFTIVHRSVEEKVVESPEVAVLVQWDGVRGGLLYRLEGVDSLEVKIGMPVVPKWAEKRTGSLDDIVAFRPV